MWRNWQTRLIQNQVPSGSDGSSPFTGTSENAEVGKDLQTSAFFISCGWVGRKIEKATDGHGLNTCCIRVNQWQSVADF